MIYIIIEKWHCIAALRKVIREAACVFIRLKNSADHYRICVQPGIKCNVGYSLPIFHSTIYSICWI